MMLMKEEQATMERCLAVDERKGLLACVSTSPCIPFARLAGYIYPSLVPTRIAPFPSCVSLRHLTMVNTAVLHHIHS